MLHQPRIVFLDEPTSGVDPIRGVEFWRLIEYLSRAGVTVLVTTHYMDEAAHCDRIAIINAGKLDGHWHIPRAQENLCRPPDRGNSFAPGPRSEGIKILIAEDNALLRGVLRDALEEAGMDVVGEASDGAEAVVSAERAHPDVVVMDMRMPNVDGIEATEQIAAAEWAMPSSCSRPTTSRR